MKKSPSTTTLETNTQENLLGEDVVLTLTIPKTDVDREYSEVLKKEAKKVTLKGFRQGKAPLNLAEGAIGQEKLMEHVLNHLLPHAYEKEVIKAKIVPIVRPEIKPKETKGDEQWVFEAHTAVAPEVKLGDYKKLIVEGAKKYQEKLEKNKDAKANDDELLQTVFVTLIEDIKPKIAPLLLQEEMSQQLSELYRQLKSKNLELADYIKSQGKTEEEFKKDLAALSLGALQLEFVLQEITKDLKLEISDDDIKTWIKTQGYPDGTNLPAELRVRLSASLLRRQTTNEILKLAGGKTIDFPTTEA